MLFEKLQADMKQAMLARDTGRTGTLRLLISAAKYYQMEKSLPELKDEDVLLVLRRQAKQRHDSIAGFEQGKREDLAQVEREELKIIEAYLPKSLSPEELTELVKAAIAEVGAITKAQMGMVMKAVTPKVQGRADGKQISQVVMQLLK